MNWTFMFSTNMGIGLSSKFQILEQSDFIKHTGKKEQNEFDATYIQYNPNFT